MGGNVVSDGSTNAAGATNNAENDDAMDKEQEEAEVVLDKERGLGGFHDEE